MDEDWVKKCMDYEVEGPRPRVSSFLTAHQHIIGHFSAMPRPRGRPKRTWREVVKEDSLACKLIKEDAIDHSKWRKLIKDIR